jgi:hypothetical protein
MLTTRVPHRNHGSRITTDHPARVSKFTGMAGRDFYGSDPGDPGDPWPVRGKHLPMARPFARSAPARGRVRCCCPILKP